MRPASGCGGASGAEEPFLSTSNSMADAHDSNDTSMGAVACDVMRPATPIDSHELPVKLHWTSLVTVLLTGASVFAMGGIVPGINSLYSVLFIEGLFRSHCTPAEQQVCSERALNRSSTEMACCDAQDDMLSMMSSIALFAADGVMLLYGEILDRSGPRACCGIGLFLSWFGFALLSANSAWWKLDNLWVAAFFCIGLSGPAIFMSCLAIGQSYPPLQAVITALAAAMWDTSSVVFFFFNELYFGADLSMSSITALWLGVIVLVGTASFSQLPTKSQIIQHAASDSLPGGGEGGGGSGGGGWGGGDGEGGGGLGEGGVGGSGGGGGGPQKLPTLCSLFFRIDTCFLMVFMGTYNLKSSFYLVSLDPQLHIMLLDTEAETLFNTFNIAFPVSGFAASVVSMWLLSRWCHDAHLYMCLVIGLACTFSIMNLVPYMWAQYIAVYLFGPTRTLQWGAYFLFLEQADRYPPEMVGRMIGYGNFFIALVGDVPPTALKVFVQNAKFPSTAFERYQLVDMVLSTVLVCCLAFPIYLKRKSRRRLKR